MTRTNHPRPITTAVAELRIAALCFIGIAEQCQRVARRLNAVARATDAADASMRPKSKVKKCR